jgi:two-component system CheB/CheR fusion protein
VDAALSRLLDKLNSEHNVDFRDYKPTSLGRRIRSRMQQLRIDDYDAYASYLESHPDEHVALIDAILINVTTFFRDPEAWAALADEVLPRLLDDLSARGALRLWSAGCSSGEEPYTLAMLLAERAPDRVHDLNVKIYATDVDEDALQTARHGLYRLEQLKNVPAALLERHFIREGQAYRLRRDLRRWCIFGRHNLAQDPPLSHVDLLVCRNVLIYCGSDLQERILARFHYAVREGGFLFLGRSESLLTRSRWFTPVNTKWRLFRRTAVPALTVAAAGRGSYELGRRGAADVPRLDLAVTDQRLRRIVDGLSTVVIVVDPEDTVLAWNALAETLFDIPADGAVGRKFRDLDVSYRVEGLRAAIEEVKSRHAAVRLDEVTVMRRSGDPVQVELAITPVGDGSRLDAVVVSGADTTEVARLREQASRLAEQHATAIEELQSTNEELETTNEELQSTNEELETTNEELQSTNEELETTVEELQEANSELESLNAQLDARAVDADVVRQHQRDVLGSIAQAIIVVDRSGIVTGWNVTAERLWGLQSEHTVGRQVAGLPVAELDGRISDALARVTTTGASETVDDVPFPSPMGRPGRLSLQVTPIKGGAGEIQGAVGIATVIPPP